MNGIDINCLLGNWPFRKLYKNTFDDLKRIHKENGIEYGYVSSMSSVFYNDPFEGEEDLHETISGTPYRHILTVNPTLPCFEQDIEKALELFDIFGVRIYPGYHNYPLDDPRLTELCELLRKHHLPLMLTLRLEDERLNYLNRPRRIDVPGELLNFIKTLTDVPLLIMNIRFGEILYCEEALKSQPNLYIDTAGIKDPVASVEQLIEHIGDSKIIYGSQYPLNVLKSTLYEVTMAEICAKSADKILWGNSASFFTR